MTSAGLLQPPLSQRSKSWIFTVCVTSGCRTVMVTVVSPFPISPTQSRTGRMARACATASSIGQHPHITTSLDWIQISSPEESDLELMSSTKTACWRALRNVDIPSSDLIPDVRGINTHLAVGSGSRPMMQPRGATPARASPRL